MSSPSPDKFARLSLDTSIGDFDCGDSDLNDFIQNDARNYLQQLFAVTYLLVEQNEIAAFFSVSNDKLTSDPRSTWSWVCCKIPNEKQLRHYPAVKLGRLGVASRMQGRGLGTEIIDWIKMSFVTKNKTGCRFITVDAYNNPRTLNFYRRNEFSFFSSMDEKKDTRQMWYDLKPFHDKILQKNNPQPAVTSGSSPTTPTATCLPI